MSNKLKKIFDILRKTLLFAINTKANQPKGRKRKAMGLRFLKGYDCQAAEVGDKH